MVQAGIGKFWDQDKAPTIQGVKSVIYVAIKSGQLTADGTFPILDNNDTLTNRRRGKFLQP